MEEKDNVVLVDRDGKELKNPDGTMRTFNKLQAHQEGLLHRAVSVFAFNNRQELLLQKRALGKYHSPGKWTNTCCTHPRPGEAPQETASRRLREEMGLNCPLTEAFTFLYKAEVGGGLIEYEYDHVFTARCNADPQPDPDEVSDWKWISLEELGQELEHHPEDYSVWVRQIYPRLVEYIKKI